MTTSGTMGRAVHILLKTELRRFAKLPIAKLILVLAV